MNINSIFQNLAETSSRNKKEEILLENINNSLLKRCIFLALDPFTQFWIKKIPAYKKSGNIPLETAIESLKNLSERKFTGNRGIDFLTDLLSNVSEPDAKVIIRIIQKDLKCGIQETTVNKIWPGLIFDYPCMLASGYESKVIKKISFPAYAQLKMDGMRFNAIVVEGKDVEFRSRNGKLLDLLGNLEEEFLKMGPGVYDGELLWRVSGSVANRQTGNGIISKTIKGTITKTEANGIIATLWDFIEYKDFMSGVSKIPYNKRFEELKNRIGDSPKIALIQNHTVDSLESCQKVYQDYLLKGEEGIILKDRNNIWENKRSQTQIKFKAELETDLKVTGIEMGQGRMISMLGAVICESRDKSIIVHVGSGFTDSQRVDFLKNNDIVGKIITVKYNARINNKQGSETLFLPIFKEVRLDKIEADSNKDIK